jgi:hypothetical protein
MFFGDNLIANICLNKGMGLSAYQLRLISAWEMTESSGARNDSRGTNHLTDNNTVTSGAGVATNDALAAVFTAANFEYLSRAAGTVTGIESKTGDFSIEIALKFNANIGVGQTIIAKGATSDAIKGFWLQKQTSARLQITLGNGTSRVSVNPTNVLTTATLYHIICTFDRDGNMEMFINNVAGTGTSSASIAGITGDLGTSSPLTIGQTSSVTYADMDVGFARFWDGLLDSTDRSYLYNSGSLRSYSQL